jgi:hypothetical protein
MKMVPYRWPVEIVRAHFALQVLNPKSLKSFFKILNRTVVTPQIKNIQHRETKQVGFDNQRPAGEPPAGV